MPIVTKQNNAQVGGGWQSGKEDTLSQGSRYQVRIYNNRCGALTLLFELRWEPAEDVDEEDQILEYVALDRS